MPKKRKSPQAFIYNLIYSATLHLFIKLLPMEIENISAHIKKLSKEDWGKLFALIPQIESTDDFIINGGILEDENDDDSFKIVPVIEAKVVLDFEEVMYDLDLVIPFNWSKWEEGRKIVNSGDYINLDTVALLKVLTAFIRNNRFCDGALASRFEDGTIEKILRELKKNIDSR